MKIVLITKKKLLNTKDSPILYYNNKYEYAYSYYYSSKKIDGARVILEIYFTNFICIFKK